MDELTKWALEQAGVATDQVTDEQADAIMRGELGIVHRVENDGLVTAVMPIVQPEATDE
jgi:hypothetical protein